MPFDALLFYVFAAVALAASLVVVGQRSPIHSVLALIASFGALAGLYVLLGAPFAAVTQIIIYAGAIMVLFLFVVMMLNAPGEDPLADGLAAGSSVTRYTGALLSAGLVIELVWALTRFGDAAIGKRNVDSTVDLSSVADIGRRLFTEYGFAFEVTSILILVAMLGAVVLARTQHVESTPSTKNQALASPSLTHYLVLSAMLFAIGTAGVFLRRNIITILLSIEIMLNAVNLTFIAFGRELGSLDGQIIVFFVMTVAAAEAAVGLAIVIALFRQRESLNPDAFMTLRW